MNTDSPVSGGAAQQSSPDSFHARTMSVSLTVKDLQKSLAWYHDVVGFSIDRKIERDGTLRGVALKAGDARITINQDDGAKGWDRTKGLGFSLQISTDHNVDDIARRITRLGGTLDSEPADMPWGVRMIRLHDPDGFKLSISAPLQR